MSLSVKQRGEFLATLRYIHVQLMETLARWVPTTPEMEVKLLFGAHLWDAAQHADALGKRVYELRMPLQASRRPADAYVDVLGEVSATTETGQRLAAVYDVMLPALDARYRQYLEHTDSLMDAPSLRVVERIMHDHARMLRESEELWGEVPALHRAEPRWIGTLRQKESAVANVCAAGD